MFLKDMKPNYDYRVLKGSKCGRFRDHNIVKIKVDAGVVGFIERSYPYALYEPEEVHELMSIVEVEPVLIELFELMIEDLKTRGYSTEDLINVINNKEL